ncbi:MAG: hypothetical protein ACHQF2_08015 [Flavobacteriales bacterium]
MRVGYQVILLVCVTAGIAGCNSIKNSGKYNFADGYYKSNVFHDASSKVYVDNSDDSIYVYELDKKGKVILSSPEEKIHLSFPQEYSLTAVKAHNYRRRSFDFDFLTIPFKYRPSIGSFPNQFNTNLSGALYMGFRNDIYHLVYRQTPLNKYQKRLTRYGFSIGLFTGIGGTAMNPWVTNNQVFSEYDGVVWMKGVSGIFAVDNFALGFCVGWDDLLDPNRQYWIYEQKAWLGLAFGISIN